MDFECVEVDRHSVNHWLFLFAQKYEKGGRSKFVIKVITVVVDGVVVVVTVIHNWCQVNQQRFTSVNNNLIVMHRFR
jgi:hypothetical protein